jgi:hypothetical protein
MLTFALDDRRLLRLFEEADAEELYAVGQTVVGPRSGPVADSEGNSATIRHKSGQADGY